MTKESPRSATTPVLWLMLVFAAMAGAGLLSKSYRESRPKFTDDSTPFTMAYLPAWQLAAEERHESDDGMVLEQRFVITGDPTADQLEEELRRRWRQAADASRSTPVTRLRLAAFPTEEAARNHPDNWLALLEAAPDAAAPAVQFPVAVEVE